MSPTRTHVERRVFLCPASVTLFLRAICFSVNSATVITRHDVNRSALSSGDRSIQGWAVLLGQHRKADDRATLGLSFADATWTGQSVRFSTILPEDEGTIGWELRVVTPTSAVLTALTENGQPIQDDLMWEMVR